MEPSLLENLRIRIAGLIAPQRKKIVGGAPAYRMYAASQPSGLTDGWTTSVTSADSEIMTSLRPLRARCRALIRDAAFAKRAKTIVVNNVIGSGMGMQAQVRTTRADLKKRVNSQIEEEFEDWSQAGNCHTGGRLHFSAMEQFLMGQVFDAGEIFIRKHPRVFGNSKIPYALEVIEPERVIDEFQPGPSDPGLRVRMGVECDSFHRPVAYWIRTLHPGEMRFSAQDIDRIERVPADQIIHLGIIERWPQTRCVPWMHAVMRKIYDTDGYSEAEIVRARGAANYMASVKTNRQYGDDVKDAQGNVSRREVSLQPGTVEVLYEDEEMNFHATNSPNPTADPFLRYLLREIAAGIGVSYESLSRDYSQSNYSSSRLSLLDDRDLWRILQMWFIRSFRMSVHRDFVRQGVLSGVLDTIPIEQYAYEPRNFEQVRFKPRGWSWVDPTKEVEAYKAAIKAGITTRTDVIAQTANGRDREDIDEERKRELDEEKAKGLVFDTSQEAIEAEIESNQKPEPPKDNSQQLDAIAAKQDQQTQDTARMHDSVRTTALRIERVNADLTKAIHNSRQIDFNFSPVTNITPQPVTVPVDARTSVTVPDRETTINVQPAAPAQVTVPVDARSTVNVEPAAPAQVTVPVDARSTVNVEPAAPAQVTVEAPVTVHPAQVTVPVDARSTVNVEPAAPAQVTIPVDARSTVNVEPAAPAQVTVPVDARSTVTVPERELHVHQTKRNGKMITQVKDEKGKLLRTVEMKDA